MSHRFPVPADSGERAEQEPWSEGGFTLLTVRPEHASPGRPRARSQAGSLKAEATDLLIGVSGAGDGERACPGSPSNAEAPSSLRSTVHVQTSHFSCVKTEAPHTWKEQTSGTSQDKGTLQAPLRHNPKSTPLGFRPGGTLGCFVTLCAENQAKRLESTMTADTDYSRSRNKTSEQIKCKQTTLRGPQTLFC